MKSLIILVVLGLAAVLAFEDDSYNSNVAPHHSIVARDTRGCDASGCNQFCRKLGHARGVCIGSYCQCRSRRRRDAPLLETPGQNHAIVRRAAGCGASSCTQFCQKLGHARGVCIGSYCQCRFQ